MKYTFTFLTVFLTQLVLGQSNNDNTNRQDPILTKKIELEIDRIINEAYPENSPGATILIAKGDKIIYKKAFGMADMELNVNMKVDNVMQLASITKQFTSVSILMLMEEGKISLNDPLSKFISDYPRGNEITIHHLLNHTSGIKNYTNLSEFRMKTRMDMSPEEIISYFKNVALDFNPGEKYEYSNSGYILLGYIIEKITNTTYEEYIQKNIFDKLKMKNSYYGNHYKIIPNRAKGYQTYDGNFENAEYMSTTIPYSAGSLMSTVYDMYLWKIALKNNTLISEKSKLLAFTDYKLNNGKNNHYGYGWAINEIAGVKTIEHTGGINGFTTSGIYVPGEELYSIILSNLDNGRGPEMINIKIISMLMGDLITKDNTTINLTKKQLDKWVGAYQFEDAIRYIIHEDGKLYSKREGGRPFALEAITENEFRFEGQYASYKFSIKDGKKQVLYTDRIKKNIGKEIDKKPAKEREFMIIKDDILNKYVGLYSLPQSFEIEIIKRNSQLFAIAMGQEPIGLNAENEQKFFIKEIEAEIIFNINKDGEVESLTFSQGGNKMLGSKKK